MNLSVKSNIEKWLSEKLIADELFLVEIKLVANKIQVYLDGMNNITIDKCAEISRFLSEKLDGDSSVPDNYTLDVSSPGMSSPLKVPQQYQKRLGRELDVLKENGERIEGVLKAFDAEKIFLTQEKKANKKDKTPAEILELSIPFNEIKKAIVKFNFK